MNTPERDEFIQMLKARFEANRPRHPEVAWSDVEARLRSNVRALQTLRLMEETGGQPDVIGRAEAGDAILFVDCSPESPPGRRSLCYDRDAFDARKEHKPKGSALDLAAEMGVSLLTEAEYFHLQTLGAFDAKTSSWIQTPDELRRRGGALFGDRRYGRVFVYHNGAESYFSARGFRGALRL